MKKRFYLGLVALFSLAACTRSQEWVVPEGDLALFAVTEGSAQSRTVVEDETHVYWEPGDAIRVFSGSKSGQFTTNLTSPSGSATFIGTLGEDGWSEGMDLWAAYPYSEEASFDGESVTMTLPSEQVARAGSFGKDMNLSVAHSTTSALQFYNVGGGVRFSLAEEGIQEIVLEGMDGEVLAGRIKVGFQDGIPAITDVTEGKTSITIAPSEGGSFSKDTWYYIVAVPGALDKGFKLHFHQADGLGFRVFDKPVMVKRGIFGTLTHADDGVTYAAVSNENISFQDNLVKSIVVKYFDTDKDGELSFREAAVVLSFLVDEADTRADDGDGKESIFAGTDITTFDELVYFTGLTRIEDGAFAGCTRLTSIIIPENIVSIGDNAFKGCTGLESITVMSPTPPAIGTDAFANTGDCPILVPEDVIEAYVSAWAEYENRIQPYAYPEPEAVDLGLPSGLKWASFNLGATSPEEKGKFFAWGETEAKEDYSWATYKWSNGASDKLTKYCPADMIDYWDGAGAPDGKAVLESEDDAAHVNLGGSWRVPLNVEWTELMKNCTWAWTTQNGVHGILFTGPNGNSIFLPAAGVYDGTEILYTDSFGTYWSACLDTEDPDCTFNVTFHSSDLSWYGDRRFYGLSIRPVQGEFIHVESVSLNTTELELGLGETSTLVATILPAAATYKAVTWYSSDESVAKVSSSGILTGEAIGSAVITAVTADGGKVATCHVTVIESSVHFPKAVDMGLPSGLKWASFNLGASKPEEYGDFYAWGETEPHYSSQDPLTWKEGYEKGYCWPSYKWSTGKNNTLTKYCTRAVYGNNGFTDSKTILDPEDDAASVLLGGQWRMPTYDEMKELMDLCHWEWTTMEGIVGYRVIGPNGNCIFLPAAGDYYDTKRGYEAGDGLYWTSSVHPVGPYLAWGLDFDFETINHSFYYSRYIGFSIRPVYGDLIPVEAVELDQTKIDILARTSVTLNATVLPACASNKALAWSSSDASVATVSANGVVSGKAPGSAIITVTSWESGKTATCTVTVEPSTIPEAIDLGLSVKWASFNLGAMAPEESGDYYAWGETEPYYSSTNPFVWKEGKEAGYNWLSYRWCNGSSDNITKYNTESLTQLEPADDAAHVYLGGKWRMPTDEEWAELRENCTFTWTTQNNVNGFLVTSNVSGYTNVSIFLPAAGFMVSTNLYGVGECGEYWQSGNNTSIKENAGYNGFETGYTVMGYGWTDRCSGLSIRPVSE